MASPSTDTLLKFLTERLELSVEELIALRAALDTLLAERVGIARPSQRRTLYLPSDSLDEL